MITTYENFDKPQKGDFDVIDCTGLPVKIRIGLKTGSVYWMTSRMKYCRTEFCTDIMDAYKTAAEIRSRFAEKAKTAEERKNAFRHTVGQHDIYYVNVGYDCDIIRFYMVTDTTDKTVTVRQMDKISEGNCGCQERIVPGGFLTGKARTCVVKDNNAFRIDGHTAYKYIGRAVTQTRCEFI